VPREQCAECDYAKLSDEEQSRRLFHSHE
jgi:hypothetical protein